MQLSELIDLRPSVRSILPLISVIFDSKMENSLIWHFIKKKTKNVRKQRRQTRRRVTKSETGKYAHDQNCDQRC